MSLQRLLVDQQTGHSSFFILRLCSDPGCEAAVMPLLHNLVLEFRWL